MVGAVFGAVVFRGAVMAASDTLPPLNELTYTFASLGTETCRSMLFAVEPFTGDSLRSGGK